MIALACITIAALHFSPKDKISSLALENIEAIAGNTENSNTCAQIQKINSVDGPYHYSDGREFYFHYVGQDCVGVGEEPCQPSFSVTIID